MKQPIIEYIEEHFAKLDNPDKNMFHAVIPTYQKFEINTFVQDIHNFMKKTDKSHTGILYIWPNSEEMRTWCFEKGLYSLNEIHNIERVNLHHLHIFDGFKYDNWDSIETIKSYEHWDNQLLERWSVYSCPYWRKEFLQGE